jgi:hypothetical protein
MKQYNILIFIFLMLSAPLMLLAQLNDSDKYITVLKGQTYIDTINSQFIPSAIVQNCSLIPAPTNQPRRYGIAISPSLPDYTGYAKAIVQYTDGFPQVKPRYTVYHINYVESKINTRPDFVKLTNNLTTIVRPLQNDSSSGGNLDISGLSNVTGGDATFSNDTVFFAPDPQLEGGVVLYSVKNGLDAVGTGLIYFFREQSNPVSLDTLRFTLLNTRSQIVFLPKADFQVSIQPTKGQVTQLHNMVFRYTPSRTSSGNDFLTFNDNAGHVRVVSIKLISKALNTSSIRDDIFYTPKNKAITFDVLENDLSSNFPIVNASPALVRDTLGRFTYTPPAGFSGVKNFTYTVNYGHYQATGKISIVVGNHQPQNTANYKFSTLKNNALVLNYDVPISNYTFNVLNQPHFGVTEVFTNSTINEDCNSFQSKLTLIYTPYNNYFGGDSFDIEYCVENNPCEVYKLYIDVKDIQNDTLCNCKGPDCIWPGDTNNDGRVSVSDLITLGRFMGLNGHSRNDIPYSFYAGQNAQNWNLNQPNGRNVKHVDTNGDGLISVADTTAISNYYANIHNLVPEQILAIKDYPFNLIPNSTNLDSGDLLVLDVMIGSNSKPVVDVFGLAFGLSFAPAIIDSTSLCGDFYDNSWFASNAPTLKMVKQPRKGLVHVGFTRTTGIVVDEVEGFIPTGVSGNGKIGQIAFIVVDEVEGFRSSDDFILRRIKTDGIEMEDADGERFLVPDTFVDIKINRSKTIAVPSEDKLLIYPNPTKDNINLHFNGRNMIKGYKIFDQMGNLIDVKMNLDSQALSINTSAYQAGMYLLQVVSTQGVITKKVNIVSK